MKAKPPEKARSEAAPPPPADLSPSPRQPRGFWRRAVAMYVDGFREMTVGRKLWAIIIIKVAFLFLVVKVFFFPDILRRDYADDEQRAQAVRTNLIRNERLTEHH